MPSACSSPGRFIDWMGTKKGYLWAIGVWSMGACHARPLRHRHRGMGGASRRRRAARRRGRVGPGRDHRHGQHVFLHRRALHPRPGRGGQLPGSHQGDRRVLPQEGPRLRHLDLQCRRFDRRAVRPADHSAAGEGLGLGDGLHRDRRPGLRLDGLLGLHVQETLGPPEGECRRAGVYRAGPARSGRRRDGRQGARRARRSRSGERSRSNRRGPSPSASL